MNSKNLNKLKKVFKIEYIIVLILLYSSFLRIIYLDSDSMWIDETLSALAARGIIEQGIPMLESGYVYDRALLFHYGMAFFINVFGGDFGARFISVVFGVLTVYLAYLFSKEFIKKSNWIFPLLVCVSSLEIIYSKQARFYQAFQFFYFLSFYLFYKIVIKKSSILNKKWLDYPLIVLSVLASIHLQPMGYVITPLLILTYLINSYKKRLLKSKKFYLIILIGIIFSFLLFNKMRYLIDLSVMERVLFYSELYTSYYFEYVPLVIFSLLGIFFSYKEGNKFTISLLSYSIIPFIGLFFIKLFATRYAYFIVFPFFFFISFLFNKLRFKPLIVLILCLIYSGTVLDFNGIEYPRLDASMPLSDFKAAYEYVEGLNTSLPVVSGWTPASEWYWEGADYGFEYSLSGMTYKGYFEYNGREKFTNNSLIKNSSSFPNEFILVLDEQASKKIGPSYLKYFNNHCNESFSAYNILVFNCTSG